MKDDYTNYHYLTYTLLLKGLGECTFWAWEWKGETRYKYNTFCRACFDVKIAHQNCRSISRWMGFGIFLHFADIGGRLLRERVIIRCKPRAKREGKKKAWTQRPTWCKPPASNIIFLVCLSVGFIVHAREQRPQKIQGKMPKTKSGLDCNWINFGLSQENTKNQELKRKQQQLQNQCQRFVQIFKPLVFFHWPISFPRLWIESNASGFFSVSVLSSEQQLMASNDKLKGSLELLNEELSKADRGFSRCFCRCHLSCRTLSRIGGLVACVYWSDLQKLLIHNWRTLCPR